MGKFLVGLKPVFAVSIVQYARPTLGELFNSKMWTGNRSYGQIPLKRWFGWLYVAGFNAFELDDMMEQTSSSFENNLLVPVPVYLRYIVHVPHV